MGREALEGGNGEVLRGRNLVETPKAKMEFDALMRKNARREMVGTLTNIFSIPALVLVAGAAMVHGQDMYEQKRIEAAEPIASTATISVADTVCKAGDEGKRRLVVIRGEDRAVQCPAEPAVK